MDAPSPGVRQPVETARRGRRHRIAAWYRRHTWTATALLIAVVLGAGLIALQVALRDRAGPGVTVAGVGVGGMDAARIAAVARERLTGPVAVAQLMTGSFRRTMAVAMGIGVTVCVTGLSITYWANVTPGATIVVLAIAIYAVVAVGRSLLAARAVRRRGRPDPHPEVGDDVELTAQEAAAAPSTSERRGAS